ncbi:autotransporter domain-containing protein [Paenalcaligenes niemegkensis]|uniref:autotransporter domain-containing protein n=1 Tax=Paenalcaligenes niemegkensis TaxID=2895469 RepID=UPI001EE92FFF|nr:autotransporter domain-containing protein [Paenalcaligenes niemegkensis]MCQ9618225.1 autotransporter domain-containing protein [Paenalcaligenes niemegkensis]
MVVTMLRKAAYKRCRAVTKVLLVAICAHQSVLAQEMVFEDRNVVADDELLKIGSPMDIWQQRLYFAADALIQRDVTVHGPMVVDVDTRQTVSISGNLTVRPSPMADPVFKFGQGTLSLSGNNTMFGGINVAEGTLRIESLEAANNGRTQFSMSPGTRLEFADGLRLQNNIMMVESDQQVIDLVPHRPVGTPPGTNSMALHVPHGEVYHTGFISIDEIYSLSKTGKGELSFEGPLSGAGIRGEFHIREGSFTVHNRSTGFIVVHDGARIRSRGFVNDLRLNDGAHLALYSPTDTFTVWSSLRMAPRSVAHIWLNNGQVRAPLVFEGDVHLGGTLLVTLSDGFQQRYPYVVVSAPDGYQGSFAKLLFTNPHEQMPSLQYQPTQVLLAYGDDDADDATPPAPAPVPEPFPETEPKPDPDARPEPAPYAPERFNTGAGAYTQVGAIQLSDSRFLREAVAGYLWDNGGTAPTYRHADAAIEPSREGAAQTHKRGLWVRVFHADLHQHEHGQTWDQQRRTEGLIVGVDSGSNYALRYGVQLGLQQSRWESPSYSSEARWESYTLGATVGSHPQQRLPWHIGVGYTLLHTHHQRETLQTSFHSRDSHALWQLYAETRPRLFSLDHEAKVHWEEPTTQVYGIAQLVQLHRPSYRSNEHWAGQGKLGLRHRAANATLMGLGAGLEHHFKGQHGEATVNLRMLRQQAVAASRLRTDYNPASDWLQGSRQSSDHSLSAWQLDLSVRAEIGKHSYVGVDFSRRHHRHSLDHTINLRAEFAF